MENKGFNYAPKFLGIDDKGREILSFIEGEAGNYPLKEYMWSDDVLIEIAKMLRLYHDAVNDFAIYNIIFRHKRPIGIIDFDVARPGPSLWDIAYALYTCVPLNRFHLSETGRVVNYNSFLHANLIKQRVALFFESYGKEVDGNYLDMVSLRLE